MLLDVTAPACGGSGRGSERRNDAARYSAGWQSVDAKGGRAVSDKRLYSGDCRYYAGKLQNRYIHIFSAEKVRRHYPDLIGHGFIIIANRDINHGITSRLS